MWYVTEQWTRWKYKNSSFKLKNWTETMKSSCLDDILREFDKVSKKYIHSDVRLKIKNKKDAVTGTFRDILGEEEKLKHPIFTQNEIARISSSRALYAVVFILLLIFEGIIYSLLSNMMVPRALREAFPFIPIVFGLALAILFVVILHFGFQFYFEYIEAKTIVQLKKADQEKLVKFKIKRNIAVFCFILFVVTNLVTAVIRAKILEPKGTDDELGHYLFMMSLGLTFIAAIGMGLLEHVLMEKNPKYAVYKNWQKQNKERKVYITAIRDLQYKSKKIIAKYAEEYWSVVCHYQRIFESRYDAEDRDLYNQFQGEIASGSITLNNIDEKAYSKYKLVQCSSEELFKYGVNNDPQIIKYLEEIKESIDEIKAYEKAVEQSSKSETPDSEKSQTGETSNEKQ